jgi:ATP-dependent Clp protease ATP-binding subunit ClpB
MIRKAWRRILSLPRAAMPSLPVPKSRLHSQDPEGRRLGATQIYLSPEIARLFESAKEIADKAGDSFVTAERLLLALAMAAGTPSADVLSKAGVTPQSLNSAIEDIRKGRKADSATAEDSYEALNKYATDLTERARSGKIDPVIGRDEEIRRTGSGVVAPYQEQSRPDR